ncbi:hypothetical protein DL768_004166 [Monosporascus sp. mg162]|nr:hypothetical protein DL768_004166 [Monosporascus sp. mg162]
MASGWNGYGPFAPNQPQGQLPWTAQPPVRGRERGSLLRRLAQLTFGSSRPPVSDAGNSRQWISGPWSMPSQVPHPAYGANSANIAAQPALWSRSMGSHIYATQVTVPPNYLVAQASPWNQFGWLGSIGHLQTSPQPVNLAAPPHPWNPNPGSYPSPVPCYHPISPTMPSPPSSAIVSPAAGQLDTVASSSRNGMQSSRVYEYQRLDTDSRQIRLLTLMLSPNLESEIQCDLVPTSLDADPKYVAISYVWGAPEPAKFIRLSGALIKVRPNLYALLQRLRFSSEPSPCLRAIWIDALCINQDDHDERNSQVQLMSAIFSKADYVFSWLGEESGDSKLAFEAIEIFTDFVNETGDDSGLESACRHLLHCLKSAEYDKHWDAVGNLLTREYWSRVWITQEIILSKRVALVCGTDMCSWSTLAAMLSLLDYRKVIAFSPTAMKIFARPILHSRSLAYLAVRGRESGDMCLSKWLSIGRQRNATDSRDRVFAVLGLTHNGGYRADYKKTKGKVFREITKHVILLERNLDVLSCCSSFSSKLEDPDGIEGSFADIWAGRASLYTAYDETPPHLKAAFQWPEAIQNVKDLPPSWVPDYQWTYRWSERHSLVVNLREECYFRAAGDSVPDVRYIESQEKMLAFGICVDDITATHPDDIETQGAEKTFQKEWKFWQEDWSIPQRYGDDAANRLAFKSTAVLGRDYDGRKQCFTAEELMDDEFFGLPKDGPLGSSSDQTHISQVDWLDAVANSIPGRRFFVTRLGFIGRGPLGLRVGDVVAVLLGGKVPFILRPSKLNCGYIMIGEAYVHGIMEGEVIEGLQEGTQNLQELTLI